MSSERQVSTPSLQCHRETLLWEAMRTHRSASGPAGAVGRRSNCRPRTSRIAVRLSDGSSRKVDWLCGQT